MPLKLIYMYIQDFWKPRKEYR